MFVFDWESDVFVLQKASNYSYDIEIKISKADYLHDFTKWEKHSIIKNGLMPYVHGKNPDGSWHYEYRDHKFRPNKFYFCVPDGLITRQDVPDYCGLMYIMGASEEMRIVKDAPFLHKNTLDFRPVLCDKFYYRWRGIEHEIVRMRRENKRLENKYETLQKQLS